MRLVLVFTILTLIAAPLTAAVILPDSPDERPLLKSVYAGGHDVPEFYDGGVKAVAFIFTSQICPVAKQYVPRLNDLSDQYRDRGIRFVAVYSNSRVDLFSMAKSAHDSDIHFLAMLDYEHRLADLLDVKVTPEVVLLDAKMEKRYQGAIDDQFTKRGRSNAARKHYLMDAIEAVVNGEVVERPYVPASGCRLERQPPLLPKGEITYHRDIAPIVQAKCQGCHREGNVAPFELMTYDDAYYSAQTIAEVVEERRMPPWHAELNPKYGKFVNDARLTDEQIRTVLAWVKAGAPEGNPADSPPNPEWPKLSEWGIGKPDYIYRMPEAFSVPKTGVIDYQFFRIRMNFEKDRWVQAIELKPGNPEVVHHITMHLVPPAIRITQRSLGWSNSMGSTMVKFA